MMGFLLSSIQLPAPRCCWMVLMIFILSGLCCFKTSNGECMQPSFSCDDGSGSGSGSGSGDMIFENCPSPNCLNVTYVNLDQANVSFSLDCTPTNTTNCSYSYHLQYLTPDDDDIIFHNQTNALSSSEIERGYFVISLSDEDEFVPGSVIRVIVFLLSNVSFNKSADVAIPGSFAPDIINIAVNSGDNISLVLSWQLRYPLVLPDMYYISYNYTELSGATPRSDNLTIMIDGNDVTMRINYNYTELSGATPRSDNSAIMMDGNDVTMTVNYVFMYTLDNLLPFTSYSVTLSPQYGDIEGEGLVESGTTEEGMSSQVIGVNVDVDRNNMRLNISWGPPSYPAGIILKYEITLSISGKICLTVNTAELSVTAEFKYRVTYNIRITPCNSFGPGATNEIDMYVIPEQAPTPPVNFTLTELSSSSLEASWKEPLTLNGVLNNYTIYCSLSSSQFYSEQLMLSINGPSTTVDPVNTTANITGLDPFTSYECYVTASTGGGESPRSNNASARTSEEKPAGPPEGFNVTGVTATSVSLEWRRPSIPNGEILHYILQYSTTTVTIPVTFNATNDEYNVTNYTVESLNEYTNYTFNISAVTSRGTGPLATTSTRTSEAAPSSPPQNLDGFNTSSMSLRITWTEPLEDDQNGVIIGYNISYFPLPANGQITNVTTSNTSLDISGLDVYTNYNVSVAAYTSAGTGPFDSTVIRTDSTVPTSPLDVSYTNISSTSIKVSWSPPTDFNGPNEGYVLTYIRLENKMESSTDRLTNTSFVIDDLEIYEQYNVTVVAFTDKGSGTSSEVLSVLTAEDLPGTVSNFSATEINTTAIRVKWSKPTEPNGIITTYELMYSKNGGNLVAVNYTTLMDSFSIVLNNLDPFSTYNIQVRAYTSVGAGNFTNGSVRTDPAPSSPPTNINATAITQTSLVLNWSPPDDPNGNIEGYYIRYNATPPNSIMVSNLSTGEQVLNVSADVTSISFVGLSPYTLYTFSIAAYSFHHADDNNQFMIVMGMFSQDKTFRTLEAAPTHPVNFTLTELSSSSLEASWEEPLTLNGVLTNYTIYCNLSSLQFYSEQLMLSINEPSTTVDPVSTTANITGLDPFTSYECYVTASTGGGESPRSNNASARTSEEKPAGPPEGFNVTGVTAISVSLEWRRPSVPNGEILHYILQYSTTTVTIPVTFNATNDEYNVTSYTVESLNEYTNYTFNISAVTSRGTGPLATTSTRTSEAAPSSPPQNLDGFNTSSMSLRITWTEPLEDDRNGVIIGYNISYFPLPANGQITNVTTTNTSLDISGLDVYTNYNVSVAAYTSAGTGPFDSTVIRTDSTVPTSPLDVSYTNISSTSIKVSWSPPTDFNGPNEGYVVTYIRLENNTESSTDRLTNTSFVIDDLEIYEQYNVTVVAFTDKGPGTSSEVLSVLTAEDLPGTVSNFSATEINTTAIRVKWSKPTEPNGIITTYELMYSKNGGNLVAVNYTTLMDSFSIVLNNLDPFSTYNIQVRAYTSVGAGNFTNRSVRTDPAPSSPPTNINATAITQTSLVLNWSPPDDPNGNIEGYYIRYNATPPNSIMVSNLSTGEQVLNVSADVTSISFVGLTPYTLYTFSIAAYSFHHSDDNNQFMIVMGMFSQDKTFRTLETAPTPPVNFTLTELSSSSLEASWKEPLTLNGVLNNYTIYCSLSSSQFYSEQLMLSINKPSTTVDPVSTTANITGLDPFTNYECYVTASTGGGESPRSNNASARTSEEKPAGPPEGFNVTGITATSVSLEWRRPSVPNGEILHYILQYSTTTVTIPVTFNAVNNEYNVTNYTVESLNEYTNYTFNISAVTSRGTGPLATTSTRTNEAAPGAVSNFSATEINTTAIRVEWSKPTEPNGIITTYELMYSKNGGDLVAVNYTTLMDSFSIVLNNLDPFSTYNIQVRAYTSVGAGAFTNGSVRTDPAPSSPPTDINATAITQTSLVLNWSPPDDSNGNIEGYYIRYNATPPNSIMMSNLSTGEQALNVSANVTSISFVSLTPYTLYTFSIAAYSFLHADDNNQFMIVMGMFSQDKTFRTLEAAPTPPVNFTLTELSSSSLEASWKEPLTLNGVLTNYTIYCSLSSSQFYSEQLMLSINEPSTTVDPVSTTANITGLDPFTNYECYVTASTGGGESPRSNNASARTSEEKPAGPPEGFNVTGVTATSVSLEWRRPSVPNGEILHYILQYSTTTVTIPVTFNAVNNEYNVTNYTVESLNEYTNYTFNISAVTSRGTGPLATTSTRTSEAAPSSPPQNLDGFNTSSMSLRITWTEPLEDDRNGVIIGYNISYFPLPANGQITNVTTTNTSLDISGLDVYTNYNVSVAAYTSAGTGPFNSTLIRTDSTVPTSPLNVSYTNISSTSIEVSWSPPTDFNGPNEGYVLTYIRLENKMESSTDRLTNTSFVIDDLEIYEQYNVTVVAFTDKGSGTSSEVLSVLTDEDLPGPPSNVATTSSNASSINITWSPPLDRNGVLLGYYINFTLNSTYAQYLSPPFDVFTASVPQDTFSFILTGLPPFAGYDISLQASTSVGLGTPAIETEITLQAAPTVPVTNLMASPVNSTAVNVSWFPPNLSDWNGLITSYTIQYNTIDEYIRPSDEGTANLSSFVNSDDPRVAITPFRLESIIIPSLHEFVNYSFIVTVSNSIGQISSLPVHTVTLESVPSGAPQNVSVIVKSTSTARISWLPPTYIDRNGIIVNYTLRIMTARGTSTFNVSDNYYDALDLPQFGSFNVVVAAATSEGLGPYSPSVSNMTFEGVPSAPDPVMIKIRNDTSINVTWAVPAEPNGNILGYLIYYIGTKNNTNIQYPNINVLLTINVTDPNASSYLITNLLADTQYSINVTAYTSVGAGAVGIGCSITLPTGRPPTLPPNATIATAPTDDSTDTTTPTTIRVSFIIPEELNANGPLMRVRILIRLYFSTNDTVDTWYNSQTRAANVAPPWQAVEVTLDQGNGRKRQTGDETVAQTIGDEGSCGPNDIVCNGPLRPDTQYQFKYRAYNSDDDDSYVESQYSGPIRTDQAAQRNNNTTTIVISVVVVLLVILLLIGILVVIIVIVLKRRKRKAYSFAASFNGKEELITAGEGKGATLSKAIQLTPTDPTIVPLTENTIVNPAAVRTASIKATPNSRKVYLRDFPTYVEDMLNDAGYKFSEEYEKVSAVGLDHSKDASLLPENRAKNRYTNILAYDHSRVKLESIDDEPGSDYINANYIPGYRMRRAYVATQGPLPSTFDDFWRMVWEQNSHVIVMLTQLVERGRTKCHRYWPGAQPEVYGEINVDMLSETEKSDWIVRKFRITKEKRSRTITHYQFVSWPDHGVPDEAGPALDFVREVHEVASSAFGPVIVHCSAGVGRTGTFIALGTLMQHIKDHDWVDLFGLASEMRQHRNHMIQTEPQYVFIHKAMVDACKSRIGIKVLPSFNPIYSNIGTASQQSDFYGDMLSEEASYQYQTTSGNGKSYDESTF